MIKTMLRSRVDDYHFCAHWVLAHAKSRSIKVLDFGCGAGKAVEHLRSLGIETYGCDIFYEGGDYSKAVNPALWWSAIQRMENDRIPFDDQFFDLIINTQVLEHVQNLDTVLGEFYRVLKPGGHVLSLFPERGVWREGHSGIPFLHWFPKGSKSRVYYAACLRCLGFGYFKEGKRIMTWSRGFCTWLDEWTFYRTGQNLSCTFDKFFIRSVHLEHEWWDVRIGSHNRMLTWLSKPLKQFLTRKLAGIVLASDKK